MIVGIQSPDGDRLLDKDIWKGDWQVSLKNDEKLFLYRTPDDLALATLARDGVKVSVPVIRLAPPTTLMPRLPRMQMPRW